MSKVSDALEQEALDGFPSIYGNGQASEVPQLQIFLLRDVIKKSVEPLWTGRLFRGKLNIVAGDPGLGKSWMTLDVAARVSHGGPWPDGEVAPQGNVLIISAEDGMEDTIRPRLDDLEADLNRIHGIKITLKQGDQDIPLSLAEHLIQIEEAIIQHQALLLILDPILAFTGRKADTHKSSDVRAVLAPLAAMADRTECAILAILHLNKRSSETNGIYRITASLDFTAAARSVLVVGKHPDDPTRRVLASVKSNLSAPPEALGYHITEDGRFTWDGVVKVETEDLLSAMVNDRSAREEAKEFLEELLADSEVPAKQVLAEARECGIAEKTLRRAAKDMGVDIAHVGDRGKKGGGSWVWRMARPGLDQDGQDTLCVKSGHLAQSGHLANPAEANKMATHEEPSDIKPNKMATPVTQAMLTTLIPSNGDDGHLDDNELPPEEEGGHLDDDDSKESEVRL